MPVVEDVVVIESLDGYGHDNNSHDNGCCDHGVKANSEQEQEYVALTRLARFIQAANQRLDRWESVLPSNPVSNTTNLPRKGFNMLRQRGRRFFRWNNSRAVEGDEVDGEQKLADLINSPDAPAFYKFLKRTTEELGAVLPDSDVETLFAEEFEKNFNRASITLPLAKFSQIYEDHFTSPCTSSSTTLHSSTKGSTRSSSASASASASRSSGLNYNSNSTSNLGQGQSQVQGQGLGDDGPGSGSVSPKLIPQYAPFQLLSASSSAPSSSSTTTAFALDTLHDEEHETEPQCAELPDSFYAENVEEVDPLQVIQTLDFLDKHLDLFIEDPSSIKTTIQLYNWEYARDTGRKRHLHFYELPFPWRENRYIINGYRFYDSHYKSLLSVVNWYGWHNETLNIWSHLFGAFYIVYLLLVEFPSTKVFQSPQVPTFGKIMVQVFLVAGLKCLISSSIWHTLNGTCCMSLRSKFACIDYTGITVLITASILSTEFVSVYNVATDSLSNSMIVYMSLSLCLGVFGSVMNWSPNFDRPESRPFRIAFYIVLAGLGMLSFLHLTIARGIEQSSQFFHPLWNKSLIWYLIGVAFYGSFIPERWRTDVEVDCDIPTDAELCSNLDILTKHKHIHFRDVPSKKSRTGFFSLWWVDYVLSSHTIWHLFVLLGVIGHYNSLLDMFELKWHL